MTGYEILGRRRTGAPGHARFPQVTEFSRTGALIAPEPGDGLIRTAAGTAASVTHTARTGLRTLARYPQSTATLFVTDSRAAVVCSHTKHGQKWWGIGGIGLFIALFMRLITAIVAAIQNAGDQVVAGQISYADLTEVSWTSRSGRGGQESVSLAMTDTSLGHPRRLRLTVVLVPQVGAAGVASDIVQRAARYLTQNPGLPPADRERLDELTAMNEMPRSPVIFPGNSAAAIG